MEIFIAEHSGFCEGVQRAYRMAKEQAKNNLPVYILGDLVHNAEVIKELEKLGIKIIKKIEHVKEEKAILIISAHGVSPKVISEAKEKGYTIVDTTCPWVAKAQKLAKSLSEEGFHVVVVGDKGHREVEGVLGWANHHASVVNHVAEIPKKDKIGVIAQTTQSQKKFNEISQSIKAQKVKIFNTICKATEFRQNAAIDLARHVDLMLVIGDQLSANTKRLKELCEENNCQTFQIQTAQELNDKWFLGKQKIGITAGASTPDWIISEVISKIKSCAKPA